MTRSVGDADGSTDEGDARGTACDNEQDTYSQEDHGDDDGVGLEYRMVYNKAVEEFICSSEMAFRTLLKE